MKGELKKLKIEAFRDQACGDSDKVDEFLVLFNPATYQQKYEIEYAQAQGQGTSASEQRFGRIKPQDYTFELIFDGTGTALERREVADDIDRFLRLTARLDGEIHRPFFLRLSWGPLIVTCVLKSADITYNLFRSDGYPLRAKVIAVFSQSVGDDLRVAEEGRESPDMSHLRTVIDRDTLPLLSHRIYRTPLYTPGLARFNDLDHLRDLRPGQSLRFPPLR